MTEAYEVLSDDKQRELYDAYGHAGVDPNSGFGGGAGGNPRGIDRSVVVKLLLLVCIPDTDIPAFEFAEFVLCIDVEEGDLTRAGWFS